MPHYRGVAHTGSRCSLAWALSPVQSQDECLPAVSAQHELHAGVCRAEEEEINLLGSQP